VSPTLRDLSIRTAAVRYTGVLALVGVCAVATGEARSQDRPRPTASARSPRASRPGALDRLLARADDQLRRRRPLEALALLERAAGSAPGDPRAVERALGAFVPPLGPDGRRLPADEAARARRVGALLEAHLAAPDAPLGPEERRALQRRLVWIALLAGDALARVAAQAEERCGLVDDEGAALLRAVATVAVRERALAVAQGALEAAARCAAHDPTPVAELGAVLLARGRADAAVDVFREVVRRRPDDPEATRDLAGALLAAGRARDALALFSSRARDLADDAVAQLDLARAALEAGEPERARDAAARAAALAPSDPEAALVQAAAALALGDRGAAAHAFREALRRRPGDVRASEGLRGLEADGT
jgi:tetratricopeptide (TPR) repeat protein